MQPKTKLSDFIPLSYSGYFTIKAQKHHKKEKSWSEKKQSNYHKRELISFFRSLRQASLFVTEITPLGDFISLLF